MVTHSQPLSVVKPLPELLIGYLKRGWHLFPLEGKVPFKDSAGFLDASNDQATIVKMARDHPGCNWGVATGASRIFGLDIDLHKPGTEELFELLVERLGPLPESPEVQTPSGGRHYYFALPPNSGLSQSAYRGIDFRAESGYLVIPPSAYQSHEYLWEVSSIDTPLSLLPPAWVTYFQQRATKDRQEASNRAPGEKIKEGSRETDAMRRAGAARRQGVSAKGIYAMLSADNDATYDPPLSDAAISRIANSVGKYAPIQQPEQSSPQVSTVPESLDVDLASLLDNPPDAPPSLVGEGILYPGGFALLAGQPGYGKSWLSTDFVISAASGSAWLGHEAFACSRAMRVGLVSMEMPEHQIARRFIQTIRNREIHPDTWRPDKGDPERGPFIMAVPSADLVNLSSETDAGLAFLSEWIKTRALDFLVLDPFSRFHYADENDSRGMGIVLSNVDKLRHTTGCAILLVHHTRKPAKDADEDLFSVRGSSRLLSDPQTILLLTKGAQNTPTVKLVKANFAQPIAPFFLLPQEDGGFLLGERPMTPANRKRQWFLDLLERNSNGLTLREFEAQPGAFSEKTISKYLSELLEEGVVTVVKPLQPGRGKAAKWHLRETHDAQGGLTYDD